MKAYLLFLAPFALACSMTGNEQKIKELATLSLDEVSGMEYSQSSNLIWTLQDKGNESLLYGLNREGNIKRELLIDIDNKDWESLAADAEGNLYIGDFGNNDNERKDLAIYRISKTDLGEERAKVAATINFKYPEQKDYPPKKTERFYDCEAFYEYNGNFYLFTKNRSSDSDGTFYVYQVPNKEGNHSARLIGRLKTCGDKSCQITGADISPDGAKVVLISEDKVYVLTNFSANDFGQAKMEIINLGHSSQKEGICFTGNKTLLLTDERTKKSGGYLYELSLQN